MRVEKLATPDDALTVTVPVSVPSDGLVPITTVTLSTNVVTVLPSESWPATLTVGLIAVPALVVAGWTVNPSLNSGPVVIANATLVAEVRPVDVAVSL